MYADDSQLYLTCKNAGTSKAIIESCVDKIRTWIATNRLILNDAKTEVLYFHSKFRSCDIIDTANIGEDNVQSVESVRNFSSYFDCTASCTVLVANIYRAASFRIYKIDRSRRYLDRTTTEQ